jgi:hypothetical protein
MKLKLHHCFLFILPFPESDPFNQHNCFTLYVFIVVHMSTHQYPRLNQSLSLKQVEVKIWATCHFATQTFCLKCLNAGGEQAMCLIALLWSHFAIRHLLK